MWRRGKLVTCDCLTTRGPILHGLHYSCLCSVRLPINAVMKWSFVSWSCGVQFLLKIILCAEGGWSHKTKWSYHIMQRPLYMLFCHIRFCKVWSSYPKRKSCNFLRWSWLSLDIRKMIAWTFNFLSNLEFQPLFVWSKLPDFSKCHIKKGAGPSCVHKAFSDHAYWPVCNFFRS